MSRRTAGTYVCDLYQTDLPLIQRSHPYPPPIVWLHLIGDEFNAWTYVFKLIRCGNTIYYGHSRNPVAYVKNLREHPSRHPSRPIALILGEFHADEVPVLIEILVALWADPRDYASCVDHAEQLQGRDLGGKTHSTDGSDCRNPL